MIRPTHDDTQAGARRLGRLVGRPLRRHAGRIAAVAVMVLGLLGLGSSAWAYWTSTGEGTGSATTATLNAPSTPAASHTGGTQSVLVTWAAPSGGVAPEGYYVTRISELGGPPVYACGTSPTVLVPSSCIDTGVPAGSYHYVVTAVYRSWTATTGPSNSVVVVIDVTRPVVTVTSVNGEARTFPFNSNAPVASIGGECGSVAGDANAVTPLIGGAPTTPATATCSAGSWMLTLSSPVTVEGSSIALSATQSDAAGNIGTATPRTVTIDTTRPTLLSIVRAGASPTVRTGPLSWTVTFSEPVSGLTVTNFGLTSTGITGGPLAVSGLTAASGPPGTMWTVTAATNGATAAAGTIRLDLVSSALIVDPVGNTLLTAGFLGQAYNYDTLAPQVSVVGVGSPLGNGSYKIGQIIPVTVTFTEPVLVGGTGTPQLTLATGIPGNTAVNYTGGSGTTTLTFTYTVAAGHTSVDLDYTSTVALALNSATLTDAATNTATLTLPAPSAAGSLGANKALVIDTTAPLVTVTRVNTQLQAFPFRSRVNVTSVGGGCGSVTGDLAPVTVLVNGSPAGTATCTAGAWTLATSWTTDGTWIVSATQVDVAGNVGTAPAQTVAVDRTRPTLLSLVRAGASPAVNAGPLTWTATFSEPVTGVATSNFGLTNTGLTGSPTITGVSPVGGSPSATWTVSVSVVGVSGVNTGSIRLNLARRGAVVDPAGNTLRTNTLNGQTYTYDTTKPTISGGVSSSLVNGRYKAGQLVPVTVTFSEVVTVGGTGTPQLSLATGSPATAVAYTSGSGSTILTFAYTVAPGHSSTDLDYTSAAALILNSGAITDAAGNAATLTLPNAGTAGSLGANKALVIDTAAPIVTAITSSLGNGTYGVGQVVPVSVTFNEAVTVTGTPQLSLATGAPATTPANYASGSGTTTLSFSYTVVAGNNTLDLDYSSTAALALNGGRIADAALNDATLTLPSPSAAGSLGANKSLVIDAAPSVVVVTSVNGSTRTFPYQTRADVASIGGTCGTAPGDVATVSPRINGNATTPATTTCSPLGVWSLTLGTALSGNGSWTLSARQLDAVGNIGNAPPQTLVIDQAPPIVSSIVRAGSSQLVNAGPLTWTVTFSEPVTGLAAANFAFATSGLTGTPTITGVAPVGPPTSATWTVSAGMSGVGGSNAGLIGLNLTGSGSVVDVVGNALGAGTVTGQAYTYDTAAPTVVGVSSTLANDSYRAGQMVPVAVTFSEPVTVSGTPQLTLATGASATTAVSYTSGSGGTTLTFQYIVEEGDNTPDLDYVATTSLALNGGTLRDAAGNSAALELPSPGAAGSLGGAKALVIDTTPPEVEVLGITSILVLAQVSGTAEVGAGTVTAYLCPRTASLCDPDSATRVVAVPLVDTGGAWTSNLSFGTDQGPWQAIATQTDAAGNVGISDAFVPNP